MNDAPDRSSAKPCSPDVASTSALGRRPGSAAIDLTSGRLLIAGDALATTTWITLWGSTSLPYFATALTAILLFASGGLYRARLHVSLLDQLPALLGRLGIATAGAGVLFGWLDRDLYLREYVLHCAVLAVAHLAFRGIACTVIRSARRSGLVRHDTLVVGSSATTRKVTKILTDNNIYGLRPIGYVGDANADGNTGDNWAGESWAGGNWAGDGWAGDGWAGDGWADGWADGWVHLGPISRIAEIIERHDVRVVVLDDDPAGHAGVLRALRSTTGRVQSIFLVPRFIAAGVRYDLNDHIGAIPVLRVMGLLPRTAQRISKRGFDLVLAALFLLVLAPVMLAVAAAIYAEDRQSVLFRQIRVGIHGKTFTMYKFRSMRHASSRAMDTQWTAESEQRIGRVGRFLRKTSLDELPQLVNILRGDMTFVGPRPERPHFVEQFSARLPHYQYRHRVPAGLTGLAQVSGLRGDTSIDDRARHDNYYIDHWNLWFDLKVIMWTLGEVIGAKGD